MKALVGVPLTAFICPGMVFRNTALDHCSAVHPSSAHAFAEGTTAINRPSTVSFNVAQSSVVGKPDWPGCDRQRAETPSSTKSAASATLNVGSIRKVGRLRVLHVVGAGAFIGSHQENRHVVPQQRPRSELFTIQRSLQHHNGLISVRRCCVLSVMKLLCTVRFPRVVRLSLSPNNRLVRIIEASKVSGA